MTGGGRGIGFALCKAVAQQGGNVAVLDALPAPVDEFHTLADRYAVQTFFQRADVTKQESLESGFAGAVEKLGPLTGCVPAAGIAIDKPIGETTWEEALRVLEVSMSPSHLTHARNMWVPREECKTDPPIQTPSGPGARPGPSHSTSPRTAGAAASS